MISLTFQLVSRLYHSIYTISPALPSDGATIFSCAWACNSHPDCGGIVFNIASSTPCKLIVDVLTAGANLERINSAYRIQSYQSGKIVELPEKDRKINMAALECQNLGFKFLPHPVTPKDKATIYLRRKLLLPVDLKYTNAAQLLTNTDGAVFDPAEFQWSGGTHAQDYDYYATLFTDRMVFYELKPDFIRISSSMDSYCIEIK